jgi:hypothetical protein
LVTKLGLLTKRGMDWFPEVYDEYYKDPPSKPDFSFSPALLKKLQGQVEVKAKDAVKIVAVWDTVEFHSEGMLGEKIELHNAELSPRVAYAYHALALDERRLVYRPTLWQWPQGYKVGETVGGVKGNLQVMKQVWFSGVHPDVGGGHYDPACSDISLAWMLAQCNKDKKLAFTDEDSDDANEYYLLPDRMEVNKTRDWKSSLAHVPDPDPQAETIVERAFDGVEKVVSADRQVFPMDRTFERIHRSIRDRDLDQWPCGVLAEQEEDPTRWLLAESATTQYGDTLVEADPDPVADAIEGHYIGRIRPTPDSKGGQW